MLCIRCINIFIFYLPIPVANHIFLFKDCLQTSLWYSTEHQITLLPHISYSLLLHVLMTRMLPPQHAYILFPQQVATILLFHQVIYCMNHSMYPNHKLIKNIVFVSSYTYYSIDSFLSIIHQSPMSC